MAAASAPAFISTNDPQIKSQILHENPNGDAFAPPNRMSPKNCRAYARTKTTCIGCGKEFHINRLRCRNVYLCDNCGGSGLWAWRWHQERDVTRLEKLGHTGVELTVPADPLLSLRGREQWLLGIYERFIKELNVSQTRMPVIDPTTSNASLRASLTGRHDLKKLTRLWRALTGGKGWLSIRRYDPGKDKLLDFFEWVFSGLESLADLPDETREAIDREFGSSQRISATRNSIYSPLPKDEQKRRRAEHKEQHRLNLCSCCGAPMKQIPPEEQEVMTLDEMQAKYPNCRIIVEDEYDPFEYSHRERVSIGRNRNIDDSKQASNRHSTHDPPS